ncbi:hypothetical protein B0A49_08711 [Cryomyces minteri]|uniref:Molybdenum cofactor sulfurase n=1 Tax=Cryomyces minteri TaxID=331657 RepID=A0A4U0WZ05_9PEZI|nr:hypothetical protein B0A49_08711 [Cryomyces minteri]
MEHITVPEYDRYIEDLRDREYPMLKDTTYLDHAGTTLYSKSLIDRFSADMMSNLYGNPHSASQSSQLSTRRTENIRLRLLHFFHADPHDFDVIFVANATAGIKLVAEALREHEAGFCLYKIFGFPDLGALIVRKASGHVLQPRKYFGGGTVDMVVCLREQWHVKKIESLHEQLEDGTLPIHNIIALDSALDVHSELFGTLDKISRHTAVLAQKLYDGLVTLRHRNDEPVCKIYTGAASSYKDASSQGPVLSFNIINGQGAWISNTEVEKLAAIKNIQLRTGGLCNPGGIASSLGLVPWEMKQNFSAGQRCGNENDIMGGKPTGMIRVSLGAMSTSRDVDTFLCFVREFFVEEYLESPIVPPPLLAHNSDQVRFHVESLTVYPIKSCAGWKVPPGQNWEIREEGLAWDREWCLVHQGTGVALSQKRYPRMALIRTSIDLTGGVLRVRCPGLLSKAVVKEEIVVPLSANSMHLTDDAYSRYVASRDAKVCGETVAAQSYKSQEIADFFTAAVGVSCQLARFPATKAISSTRHSKAHLQQHQLRVETRMPGTFPASRPHEPLIPRPILLSNESPILVVSRSSLNRLNEHIKASGGKAAQAEVFRANIVVAEDLGSPPGSEQPYVEDQWRFLRIGRQYFQMLGSCRRCQMVCIDQDTAAKNEEPFTTLAKTRRFDGKVFFGQHTCYLPPVGDRSVDAQNPTIMVGDPVRPFYEGEEGDDSMLSACLV